MDIPRGKRESENCRGGVVRGRDSCERASAWRGLDAVLVVPHLAYRDERSILTVSRVGRRVSNDPRFMLKLHVYAYRWRGSETSNAFWRKGRDWKG